MKKYDLSNYVRCNKNSDQRDMDSTEGIFRKEERSKINNLCFHHRKLIRDQIKFKVSRRKKKQKSLKFKAIEKINKTKRQFFEKVNKINKPGYIRNKRKQILISEIKEGDDSYGY